MKANSNKSVKSCKKQLEELANVIMFEIPGEPSRSEGAIDCAIRLLRAAYATEPVSPSTGHEG